MLGCGLVNYRNSWGAAKKGKDLRRIMPSPSKQVLYLHRGINKAQMLWSLELASGFFYDFFAYHFGGGAGQPDPDSTPRLQGQGWRERWRIPTRSQPSEIAKFTKEHGRGWRGIWHRRRVILSLETPALVWRNSWPVCRLKLRFFYLCFSY